MGNLGKVMYLTQAQYNTLQANGTLTVGGVTYTYSENDLYLVPSEDIEIDSTPTSGSDNPVSSGGVYTALQGKQNTLTIDSTPTENSTNPVTSGGVAAALKDDPLFVEIDIPILRKTGSVYTPDLNSTPFKMAVPKNQRAQCGSTIGTFGCMRRTINDTEYCYPFTVYSNKIGTSSGMYGNFILMRTDGYGEWTDVLPSDTIGIPVDLSNNMYYDPVIYLSSWYQYGVYDVSDE